MKKVLTIKDKAFLKAYVINGGSVPGAAKSSGLSSAAAYRLMKEDLANEFISQLNGKTVEVFTKIATEGAEKSGVDYAWKLKRLREIIELSIEKEFYTPAIAAIAECNRMQGDHAAEKRAKEETDKDKDLQKLIEVTNNLTSKFRQEY